MADEGGQGSRLMGNTGPVQSAQVRDNAQNIRNEIIRQGPLLQGNNPAVLAAARSGDENQSPNSALQDEEERRQRSAMVQALRERTQREAAERKRASAQPEELANLLMAKVDTKEKAEKKTYLEMLVSYFTHKLKPGQSTPDERPKYEKKKGQYEGQLQAAQTEGAGASTDLHVEFC
tara:strand:+ start:2169 stop:2699 length:531 start_codon:yes stop_codon:yes gene_type:complete